MSNSVILTSIILNLLGAFYHRMGWEKETYSLALVEVTSQVIFDKKQLKLGR